MKPEQDKGSVWSCETLKFGLFLFFILILNMPFPQLMQFWAIVQLPGMRVTFSLYILLFCMNKSVT